MTTASPPAPSDGARDAFVAAMILALEGGGEPGEPAGGLPPAAPSPPPPPATSTPDAAGRAHARLQFDFPAGLGEGAGDLAALSRSVRADLGARRPLTWPATPRLVANLSELDPPPADDGGRDPAATAAMAAAWDGLAAAYTLGLVRAGLEGGAEYAGALVAGLAAGERAGGAGALPQASEEEGGGGAAAAVTTVVVDIQAASDGSDSDYGTPIHQHARRGAASAALVAPSARPPPPLSWPATAAALTRLVQGAARPASRGSPGWSVAVPDALASLAAAARWGGEGGGGGAAPAAALLAPAAAALLLLARDRLIARPADASAAAWPRLWSVLGACEPLPPLTPGRRPPGGAAALPAGLRAALELTAAVAGGWRTGGRGRATAGPRSALTAAAVSGLIPPTAAALGRLVEEGGGGGTAADVDAGCAALAECVWASAPAAADVCGALLSTGAWRAAAMLLVGPPAPVVPPGLASLALAGAGADARLASYLGASPAAAAWAAGGPLGPDAALPAARGAGAVLAALGGGDGARLGAALAEATASLGPAVASILAPMAAAARGGQQRVGLWGPPIEDALANLAAALTAAAAAAATAAAAKAALLEEAEAEGGRAVPASHLSGGWAREALRLAREARGGASGGGGRDAGGKDD